MSDIIKDYTDGGVFKLFKDSDVLGRVLKNAKVTTNAGRMSCSVVISTDDEDRSGDLVVVKGIDTSDHRKNPIALLNHDKNAPIGRFMDKLGNYTVKMRGEHQLVGEVYFNQSSDFAHDVFRACENGVFSATSIGFIPKRYEKRRERGTIYHESKMVEGSVLTIGDNPNALIEAVHKGFGGKPLHRDLLTILSHQTPERPAMVTSGFTPAPSSDDDTALRDLVSKAMDDTLLGGGGQDPMAPPDAQQQQGQDDGAMSHEQLMDRNNGEIAMSLLEQALADPGNSKPILQKLKKLLNVHHDLKGTGGDPDLPDLGEDGDVEDVSDDDDLGDDDEFGDDDAESDDSDDLDDSESKPKKKKKPKFEKSLPDDVYDAWTDEGAGVITKAYKFLVALSCQPRPVATKRGKLPQWTSQEKVESIAKSLIAEMESHIRPVQKHLATVVTKSSEETKPTDGMAKAFDVLQTFNQHFNAQNQKLTDVAALLSKMTS